MNEPSTTWKGRGILAGLCALCVPSWTLIWSSASLVAQRPEPVGPFAYPAVAVFSTCSVLPLAWLLCRAARVAPARRSLQYLLYCCLGSVVGLVTLRFGHVVESLITTDAFLYRHLVRVFWCLLLTCPWMLAMHAAVGVEYAWHRSWIDWAIVACLAGLLPAFYAIHLSDSETRQCERYLRSQRVLRALETCDRLYQLGSSQPIGELPVPALRMELTQRVLDIQQTIQSISQNGNQPMVLAEHYLMLDDYDAAREALEHVPDQDPRAALKLATILQYQERWADCDEQLQRTLELLDGENKRDQEMQDMRVEVIRRRVDCLRQQKQFRAAESVLQEALRSETDAQATFHFELGRHYQMGGRPWEAAEQFQLAGEADPAFGPLVQPMLSEMAQSTPFCAFPSRRLENP